MTSPLGESLPHDSAWRHVTGTARYIDDMPEPPGMLHCMVLPSPHARARILGADASAARAQPGVHAVLFGDDVPGENQVGAIKADEPLLAAGEVHCVGQAVAAVYAETREQARHALSLIEIEWEVLPAVRDLHEAIRQGSFHVDPHVIARGEPDAAMAKAPFRMRGQTASGGQEHMYLEVHAALAVPGEGETVHVTTSNQHPTGAQVIVARVLGWGRHQVVIESPRMGGGFGGKETQGGQWAAMAALGAVHTGRAVKLRFDRHEDIVLTGRRHPFHSEWEVGYDEQGRVLSFVAELFADAGFAADLSPSILDRALYHADNAYWLPDMRITGQVVRTHSISNTAFRGFGAPQGMLVIEHVMERIADATGLDPLEVRRANLYGPAPRDVAPYGQPIGDFRIPRILDQLTPDLEERRAAVAAFNRAHTHRKRGLAVSPVKFGISFTNSFLNQVGAYLTVYTDGSVQLNHGGTEMGQGLYTKMMQICAHDLGVPLDRIRQMPTATDKVPNTPPTAASSGSDLNGQAVRDACVKLVARLRPLAAEALEVPLEELHVAAGNRGAWPTADDGSPAWAWTDQGRSMSFAQACTLAWLNRTPLASAGYYATPDIHYDRPAGRGKPFHYFAYGAAISEVEVNGLTGEWRLRWVRILHDVGDSLNPDIDRGQIEGGFLQGVGWLTCEEMIWDGRGHPLTVGPSTYKIPAIGDAPLELELELLDRAHTPEVIHGSKAVGEPPFCLAISTWLALRRSVQAFGGRELPVPATPEALALAIEQGRGKARALDRAAPSPKLSRKEPTPEHDGD
jgi:xanthine dehydrogenase large subunit